MTRVSHITCTTWYKMDDFRNRWQGQCPGDANTMHNFDALKGRDHNVAFAYRKERLRCCSLVKPLSGMLTPRDCHDVTCDFARICCNMHDLWSAWPFC